MTDQAASIDARSASIRIGRDTLEQIIAHALEERPRECCGILLGSSDDIVKAVRARNIATEPTTRFLVDPGDHIAALRRSRRPGFDVVGFYHSHPRSRALPSPRDVVEVSYLDTLSLIVGLSADPVDVRAFRMRTDGFEEIRLIVRQNSTI